jgi:uncharacterized paraquat-inducible protein A
VGRERSRRSIELRCPECDGLVRVDRDDPGSVLCCEICGADITPDAKRALMREVAVGIASQLVERENRAFFEMLEERWSDQ